MKNQYESLNGIFFCDDFVLDNVLREFSENCKKAKIQTDILFHEYKRKNVTAADASGVLRKMIEYGFKALRTQSCEKPEKDGGKISIHGAAVQNQLVFVMRTDKKDTDTRPLRIRVRKRDFYPWLKKYDGLFYADLQKQSLQLVIGLRNH